MPTWNPNQYLKFEDERTRPCRDLVSAITAGEVNRIGRIIDLGSGPGNSTQVLAQRWPDAQIAGLDNSAAMIDAARRDQPQRTWIAADITEWARTAPEQFDLVFSNAALQWVGNHQWLFPKLFERVKPGGAFAVQIPADFKALQHRLMRELAPGGANVKSWFCHEPEFYYDVLAPHAARVDVWESTYQHVLPNADAIVEWYKGTALRSYLEAMTTDAQRDLFLSAYTARIREAFQPRPDGKVLFPFRRLFVTAYR